MHTSDGLPFAGSTLAPPDENRYPEAAWNRCELCADVTMAANGEVLMRLTRKDDPTEIKEYEHIKAAPTFGPMPCFARIPEGVASCTLSKGHGGPHVAHGGWRFKKVYAVWDE